MYVQHIYSYVYRSVWTNSIDNYLHMHVIGVFIYLTVSLHVWRFVDLLVQILIIFH
jgi:hypothetical protein